MHVWCGYIALEHSLTIDYLQVLGKSAKPIPVLLLGVLIGRKRYPLLKYMIVLFIVVGVALFLYDDNTSLPTDEHTPRLFHVLGIGELLVVRGSRAGH